jgi:tRNA wybutosine-synthesizing protein 2
MSGDDHDGGQSLAAVVEKTRAQDAIDSLRAEGVYDDGRPVSEAGGETVALPVVDPPRTTDVLEVVRDIRSQDPQTLGDCLDERGWTEAERDRAPGSWAVVGHVVLVDVSDAPRPTEVGEALLSIQGGVDTVLARGGISGESREPDVEVIAGEGDTETVHREHGTEYALDLAEVMFSPGNKAERVRMGEVVCDGSGDPSDRDGDGGRAGERVLDAFAGIGYFTLPMARAGARVTAVERNPTAFEYLLENAVRNGVTDRVAAYRGDCREVVPSLRGDFDRVVMGYYDAHEYLDVALGALESGGVVHVHEATPEPLVPDRPVGRVREAVAAADRTVDVLETRRVKGYSEGVDHVVVDARID